MKSRLLIALLLSASLQTQPQQIQLMPLAGVEADRLPTSGSWMFSLGQSYRDFFTSGYMHGLVAVRDYLELGLPKDELLPLLRGAVDRGQLQVQLQLLYAHDTYASKWYMMPLLNK